MGVMLLSTRSEGTNECIIAVALTDTLLLSI